MQYYHKIGIDVIKAVQFMCDELFFNPADTFKEWYTTYGGE